uniref:Uncharacterized protein n=1 Tax=Aegilops tauschii subsp. strangulata TaxID=200361 RepID=A0A452Y6P7_AEGTS
MFLSCAPLLMYDLPNNLLLYLYVQRLTLYAPSTLLPGVSKILFSCTC